MNQIALTSNTRLWISAHRGFPEFSPIFFNNSPVTKVVLPDRLFVQAYLPESRPLIELPPRSELQIRYVKDGPPNRFDYGFTLITFHECKIVKVEIPNPVNCDKNVDEALHVEVEVECLISIDWNALKEANYVS